MLKSVIFFQPSEVFLRWVSEKYKDRKIYDVGAGSGLVGRDLERVGVNVISMDLIPQDDSLSPVTRADGRLYPYQKRSVVMMCRPCHGDFVQDVFLHALQQDVSTLIYVGLERNLEKDLGGLKPHFRLALTDIGESGENAWVLESEFAMKPNEKKRVCLIEITEGHDPGWWMDGGDRWVNPSGGYFPKSPDDKILKEEFLSYDEWQEKLDWSLTYPNQEGSPWGWLSPKGEFYGCGWAEHEHIARYIFKKKNGDELSADGYVRVDGKGGSGIQSFRGPHRYSRDGDWVEIPMTKEQENWLVDHGHSLNFIEEFDEEVFKKAEEERDRRLGAAYQAQLYKLGLGRTGD